MIGTVPDADNFQASTTHARSREKSEDSLGFGIQAKFKRSRTMDGLLAWMPLLSLAGHAFFYLPS
jgi:hypothetical protein